MSTAQHSVPNIQIIYEKVRADSQFSLYYFREVDTVINAVTDARNNAEIVKQVIDQFVAQLSKSGGRKKPIDPTDSLAEVSISAEAAVKKTIAAFEQFDGAILGTIISTDHAEEVAGINKEAIYSLKLLHDAMVDLRWAVIEHDADLEDPAGTTFDNVEDLTADLRSA